MADIVLTTLNARYQHAAFGLRYLMANLGELRDRADLLEFDLTRRPLEVVESLLAVRPRIVGFGVYIWNVTQTTEVVALLKRLRPELVVVLGGPEVSYPADLPPVADLADCVITGEADLKFAEVCRGYLSGSPPPARIVSAGYANLAQVALPYELYDDRDIAERVVYVEASRGCPFGCEFCLSSLEVPVRQFELGAVLAAMDRLLERGLRQFKFVDRTFNLSLRVSRRILEFFRERHRDGLFLHFEMVPDRLPRELRELLGQFPDGVIQLEVGIQTFNEEVARRINRHQDYARIEENLRFLRRQTGVHLHADLIVGLPGELPTSIGAGFDRLIALGPQEIQVGILKRLRGTPITRHDADWGMVYSPIPPYELLESKTVDFSTMQRLRRFARFWDLVGNSGNFVETAPLLWRNGGSAFAAFLAFSDWLFQAAGRQHAIALPRLAEFLFDYLTRVLGQGAEGVAETMRRDYARGGRGDELPFLRPPGAAPIASRARRTTASGSGPRQRRHGAARVAR